MTSFKTPARGRWSRDNASGATQSIIAPGSMAINWPDKKIYVGGTNGTPVLFSQWLSDFNPALTYKQGDYCLFQGNLLRATTDHAPAATPSTGWEVTIGASEGVVYAAAVTGPTSGGAVAITGATSVSVSAGDGVVVDNTEIDIPDVTLLEWGGFSLTLSDPGEQWSLIGISAAGVGVSVPLSSVTPAVWRRQNILLAAALWSAGSILQVVNLSVPAGQAAENFRDSYFAQGGAFRTQGLRLTPGGTLFTLDFSAGTVMSMGGEWRTDPYNPNLIDVGSITGASLRRATRDQIEATGVTTVDKDNYDNGGVLTATPAGKWTIQYVTASPDFGQVYIHYGQTLYDSAFSAAEQIPEDYEAFDFFAGPEVMVLCGAVIVGPDDGALAGSRVINALNDPNPFVGSISQETGDFLLLDGSRPMTGALDMNSQNIDGVATLEVDDVISATIQCRSLVWA